MPLTTPPPSAATLPAGSRPVAPRPAGPRTAGPLAAASLTRRQGFTALAALTTGVLGTGSLAACSSSSAADEIVFAAVPAETSQTLEQSFGHIVSVIEQATGRSVTFQNASDYAAVIEGQRAGKVDIASYGPFSYVIAQDSGIALEAVAAGTHEEGTAPTYTSLCYTAAGSDIASLADLSGRKVAFVDNASTSGYLVPLEGLMGEGLDEADLEVVLTGGHDAALLALADGDVDAAFTHDTMLSILLDSGQVDQDALTPIWESDPIPEDPIALNTSTLDPDTLETIRTALRDRANKPALVEDGICESEEDCELPEEIGWGYATVTDEDYDPIRRICSVTEADACTAAG